MYHTFRLPHTFMKKIYYDKCTSEQEFSYYSIKDSTFKAN